MYNAKVIAALLTLATASPTLVFAQDATADPTKGDVASSQLNDIALAYTIAAGTAQADVPSQPGRDPVAVPKFSVNAGGIIAGEDAQVTVDNTNTVLLKENAQQNVNTVNLVNNSGAITDNATNIWNGNYKNTQVDLVPLSFNSNMLGDQQNVVIQTDGNSAAVGKYNDYANAVVNKSSSSADHSESASVTAGSTSSSILDGMLYESSESVGRGLAATGNASLNVDAGEVNVGGSITTGASVAWGLLSGETTMAADVTVELPKLSLDVDATACAALDGASCNASDSGHSTSSSESTLSAALRDEMNNAYASIITKDDAVVTVTEVNLVEVRDNAQQNVNAVNLINAAGGMVGNGLNIANNSGMSFMAGSVSTVRQSNILIQSR